MTGSFRHGVGRQRESLRRLAVGQEARYPETALVEQSSDVSFLLVPTDVSPPDPYAVRKEGLIDPQSLFDQQERSSEVCYHGTTPSSDRHFLQSKLCLSSMRVSFAWKKAEPLVQADSSQNHHRRPRRDVV